jgi:protein-S-isoprenylcysteine O-methyltransferase Ste14
VRPTRALGLLYALVAYVAAVRALLYLVCFLENVWVRRTVDSGPVSPPLGAAAVDLGLFALFAASHSVLALPAWKRTLARLLPPALERSTYVLVAGLVLALLFWQWRPLPATVWRVDSPLPHGLLRGLGIAGWLLAVVALRTLGHARTFGLSQAWHWARGREPRPETLVRRGVYRLIRHPLDLAFLLGCWATPEMSAGRLLFAAAATSYIGVGTLFEERHLRARLGEPWERYRREVPALLPRLRRPAPAPALAAHPAAPSPPAPGASATPAPVGQPRPPLPSEQALATEARLLLGPSLPGEGREGSGE